MIQTAAPTANVAVAINGNVHGGQQAVSGAHVYLFAASNAGYGSNSISLLQSGGTGVTLDGSGNGYVTTDANGNFTMAGDINCATGTATSTSETYMLAVGGNPGLPGTVNNTAITLMAGTGVCIGLTSATQVAITEVSTVATISAIQQFMTSPTAVASTAANYNVGLQNAFTTINSLASVYTVGSNITSTALATTPNGRGTVPQTKINTLANILAPCINSSSSTSSACASLFSNVYGGTATDVASAMLLIAKNPTQNVPQLFALTNSSAPYSPALSAAPQSFALGITYSGGGLTYPGALAIDANQNVWIANSPSNTGNTGSGGIVGLNNQGLVLSGTSGYTSHIYSPQGIAIDASGNIWTADLAYSTNGAAVVKTAPSGSNLVAVTGSYLGAPAGIAIDGSGNAFVTDTGSNGGAGSLYQFSTGGTLLQTINPSTNGVITPTGVALDGSGNVIVAATGSSNFGKFSSSNGSLLAQYSGAGLNQPIALAVDASNQGWTVNNATNSVSIINLGTGAAVSPSTGYNVSLDQATVVSIAGDNTAWIASCNNACDPTKNTAPDAIIHLNSSGTILNSTLGQQGIVDPGFGGSQGTAIDQSGNLWVSNGFKASVTELVGVASPVKTPLSGATVGVRP